MEFNKIVLLKLEPIISKYNLSVIEQRTGYLRIGSQNVIIIISHNPFEDSNTLWLGRNDKESIKIEIDNNVLKLFFKSNLKLNKIPFEAFINNLVFFLENEAALLLDGDTIKMKELEQFDLERSRRYTGDLLRRQNLVEADEAWKNKDYQKFVELIDKIKKENLPLSYQSKYKIATEK